ncbi:MAG TPA: hypothetical protein VGJ29_06980 [Vicinamibacterales bacterium]|jgi:hypothetical protein
MTTEDYRAALASAVKEYESLGDQRRTIDDRLAQLAQTISTLTRLLGLVPTIPLGLTNACRIVLRGGLPLTPVEVRERLLGMGVDLSVYSNDLSAIHTVLKRLNESGELRLVPRANGKHSYLWQKPAKAVAIGPEVAEFIRGMDNRYHISDEAAEEEGPDRDDDAPARPRSRRRRSAK